jgi:hypothetical protein
MGSAIINGMQQKGPFVTSSIVAFSRVHVSVNVNKRALAHS